MSQRLIGLKEVRELSGLSTRTIRRYVIEGRLPRPLAFSKQRLIWREKDLDQFFDLLTCSHIPEKLTLRRETGWAP
jgi:predicted DNA-binding transcriptional regulator AlpA